MESFKYIPYTTKRGARVGDVVRLKSGGPDMTVEHTSGRSATLRWFVGDCIQTARFESDHCLDRRVRVKP